MGPVRAARGEADRGNGGVTGTAKGKGWEEGGGGEREQTIIFTLYCI